MSRWGVEAKKADFAGIAQRFGISQVTARILRNRDIISDEQIDMFLNGTADMMYDPHLLKDACRAAEMISSFIDRGKKIRIIGDYDVDGVCSSYILLSVIRKCGGNVDAQIPQRVSDGYGINERLIKEAGNDSVDLIVTCDNGIAAYEQIEYAHSLGLTVIVTDHHEVPFRENENGEREEILPPAEVIVDPHREGETYPYVSVCGAVVAMKVMYLLLDVMDIKEKETIKRSLLEEAACATVCDVMPLLDENRIIVKEGLAVMNGTDGNTGLHELIIKDGFGAKKLSAYNIGFGIGPCINASGRLDTAKDALDLLCAHDERSAEEIADKLVGLNTERQKITLEQCSIAEKAITSDHIDRDDVMIVYLPDCMESVAGIVAGKIREKYYHPVFVVTDSQDGLKGSGRSIETYDMFAHMVEHSSLFSKFGGHKAAAGFSMEPDKLDEMRTVMNEESGLSASDFEEKKRIDVPMPVSYISEGLLTEFERLEPFGTGNPRPLFAEKNVKVISKETFGKEKQYGRYKVKSESGAGFSMISFGNTSAFDDFLSDHGNTASIIYSAEINEYRGSRKIQIMLCDFC